MKSLFFLGLILLSPLTFSSEVCELTKNKKYFDIQCSSITTIEKLVSAGLIGFKDTESMRSGFVIASKKMDAIKLMLNEGYESKGNGLFIKK